MITVDDDETRCQHDCQRVDGKKATFGTSVGSKDTDYNGSRRSVESRLSQWKEPTLKFNLPPPSPIPSSASFSPPHATLCNGSCKGVAEWQRDGLPGNFQVRILLQNSRMRKHEKGTLALFSRHQTQTKRAPDGIQAVRVVLCSEEVCYY